MQPSKEFQEKMRVINAINEFEKVISKALAVLWTTGRAIIPQRWEESALNSGMPTKMTRRALWLFILEVRKVPRRSVDLACLSYSQCLGLNNENVTRQKQPPQERRKPTLTKKIAKAHLTSAENIWINPKKYFACCQKWKFLALTSLKKRKKNTTVFQYKNIIPWLKYGGGGGGGGMVWACISVSGPEKTLGLNTV